LVSLQKFSLKSLKIVKNPSKSVKKREKTAKNIDKIGAQFIMELWGKVGKQRKARRKRWS